MNTGVQRSSTTPLGASTTTTPVGKMSRGKPTGSKNLPMVMLMHRPAYLATATLSHLEDFAKKLQKAKEKAKEGFVYLHIFCPCPVGWRVESNMSIEVCRTAVRTNYFPLWEAEDGKPKITVDVASPRPVTEFTKLIRKFSHLKEDELASLQKQVDERYALLKKLCNSGT
jgi:pyruvate/2-oxoacid:ferredoxin oxidoreductase beta subunit